DHQLSRSALASPGVVAALANVLFAPLCTAFGVEFLASFAHWSAEIWRTNSGLGAMLLTLASPFLLSEILGSLLAPAFLVVVVAACHASLVGSAAYRVGSVKATLATFGVSGMVGLCVWSLALPGIAACSSRTCDSLGWQGPTAYVAFFTAQTAI